MFKLYKKVPKSIKYPTGAQEIEENQNPFKEGPCMLCISAQDLYMKSIFGITKCGAHMARIRVNGEKGARIPIQEVPVSFLSLKNESLQGELLVQAVENFVQKYIDPLISKNGKKISMEVAMKNMRNVNIIAYCNGTYKAEKITETIKQHLHKLNYTENETKQILQQIAIITFATQINISDCDATVIDFRDIYDNEIEINYSNIPEEMLNQFQECKLEEKLFITNDNRVEYLIKGSGEHNIKEYTKNGQAMPIIVSRVISNILENSIENFENDLKPLTLKNILEGTEKIIERAENGVTIEEQFKLLDETIRYGGKFKRLTDREIEMMEKTEETVEQYEEEMNSLIEKNRKLEENIQKQNKTVKKLQKMLKYSLNFIRSAPNNVFKKEIFVRKKAKISKEDQEKYKE